MNKFVIFTLAATALVPVSAVAQSSHAVSSAHSASRAHSSAISQHRGGHRMMQRHHGNRQVFMHRRGGNHIMRGGNHIIRRHHGINRHHNFKRIHRGFIVPHFWWGPQFHIQNWSLYGFAQPLPGRRWIRYYDDALLIDQYGRVHDGRWGMNWDEYEDRWAYDDQGIPYYDGDEEYEDYDRDERGYAEHDGPPPPPPPMPCPQACAHPGYGYGYAYPGYGYGYGYGYGWMPGGMVTITETTVHAAAPQTVTRKIYIEKPVKTKVRRSYKRAKPRPQPGERG
jgi:Ni/Co efflux regulator RcnB